MTLDDIFEALSTGELAQVVMGTDGEGGDGIPTDRRKQIRHSIQLGLTDLHGQFLIREKAFTVNRVDGKTTYVLSRKFAQSNKNSQESNRYIDDTADPFKDDLLKIERIYDADGKKVALNELDNDKSVRTIAENILSVPEELKTDSLKVVFRANHPEIDKYVADAAPNAVEVALPLKYLQALLFFVASRSMNPVGFTSQAMHEGNNYAQKYEIELRRLKAIGAGIETGTQNTKLEDNGWV